MFEKSMFFRNIMYPVVALFILCTSTAHAATPILERQNTRDVTDGVYSNDFGNIRYDTMVYTAAGVDKAIQDAISGGGGGADPALYRLATNAFDTATNAYTVATNAITRKEIESGYTEWVCESITNGYTITNIIWDETTFPDNPRWVVSIEGMHEAYGVFVFEPKDALVLERNATIGFRCTRLRLPTIDDIPTKTSELLNDSGFVTTNDVCGIVTNTVPDTRYSVPSYLDELWLDNGVAGPYQTEEAVVDKGANTVSWKVLEGGDDWFVIWNYADGTLFDPATENTSSGITNMPLGGYWTSGGEWVPDEVDVGPISYESSTQTVSYSSRNALGVAFLSDMPKTYPVYSDTPSYTKWVCVPSEAGGTPFSVIEEEGGEPGAYWMLVWNGSISAQGYSYSTSLTWEASGNMPSVTATRARTDLLGYVLGDQTDHVLLATNSTNVSLGGKFKQGDISTQLSALGEFSSAFGCSIATGAYSHAEGGGFEVATNGHGDVLTTTIAEGTYAHAEGTHTYAKGAHSHAEGCLTYTGSNGAHAEGMRTTALARYTHAEGSNTLASVIAAHAEGTGTTASGDSAHSEGKNTTASGSFSHAEGYNTISSNLAAHAEGRHTTAGANVSHASGIGARAFHPGSFVWQGTNTIGNSTGSNITKYDSHGDGTFNINPMDGINGFWIGEQRLMQHIDTHLEDRGVTTTNDIILNPVYGGDGKRFSEWVYDGIPNDDFSIVRGLEYTNSQWTIVVKAKGGSYEEYTLSQEGVADETDISFSEELAYASIVFSANRSENTIIGYTMGTQTNKVVTTPSITNGFVSTHQIETLDTSYRHFNEPTNINQTVQFVTNAPNNVLEIQIPIGDDSTKDWIVYAFFPTNVQISIPNNIFWFSSKDSVTNEIAANTMTAFYFTQIADGAYVVSRSSMTPLIQGSINNDYGRPIEEGAKIEYGPSMIAPNIRTPTENEYNSNGFYHVNIEPPNPPEGEEVSSTTYIITNNQVEAVYTYEPTNTVQTSKSYLLDLSDVLSVPEYSVNIRRRR